jgi:hypothetical protein
MGEVVGELGALLLLALHDPRREEGLALQEGAQAAEEVGVLREPLGQDVARAGERLLRVRHLVREIAAASVSGGVRRSARIASASGSRPRSRAMAALVRRLGLKGR